MLWDRKELQLPRFIENLDMEAVLFLSVFLPACDWTVIGRPFICKSHAVGHKGVLLSTAGSIIDWVYNQQLTVALRSWICYPLPLIHSLDENTWRGQILSPSHCPTNFLFTCLFGTVGQWHRESWFLRIKGLIIQWFTVTFNPMPHYRNTNS